MLVLVADDDRAVREALERALQLHGYEVDACVGRRHGADGRGRAHARRRSCST